MANGQTLMERGMDRHVERLFRSQGVPAVYRSGRFEIELTAVPGASVFDDLTSDMDVRSQNKLADWIIQPAELLLGGERIEPKAGDQLVVAGWVYDVGSGISGSAWSWANSRQTFLRVHTLRRGRV